CASAAAASTGGAPVGAASHPIAARAGSSSSAAIASSASALRRGSGNGTCADTVASSYTARVRVRHHELDAVGRVQPSAMLRYLAQAAVEASAAAGMDADWYARSGTQWIVRRSTFEVAHPVLAGARLAIRTWVEDVRRVRSHRRYEVVDAE